MLSTVEKTFPEPIPRPQSWSRQVYLGNLRLASRYVLAPLAGYTNLAFRLAVREIGGLGLATTDLINARALLKRSRKTMELLSTCREDRPLSVQIYGTVGSEMAAAAQWLQEYGASVIDINMGCPVHKVTKGGGGSALMCDTVNTVAMVRTVVDAVKIPVTVKMRLGWDSASLTAPFFAREFEKIGVAAVTIHGRTREQGFGGRVDLDGIRAVVEAVEKIPIIGNGDVRTLGDAERMLAHTGCAALAIGRGALLNPWFFLQLHRQEETGEPGPSGNYDERVNFMSRHFHLLVEDRSERFGCLTFRKVANWYCKVLRPGREIHNRLMEISSVADFDEIVCQMREIGKTRQWRENELDAAISVPKGPIEHW